MLIGRALDPGALRDRLVASDPNGDRLRTGLRALLAAAAAAELLSRLAGLGGVPPTVWLLGVTFAMSCAVFVPEGPAAAERRGFAVVTASASGAAALAAFSSAGPPWVGAALSLVIVFVAVWSRRFPAAGVGAGMAAFLTFFVARYFALRPSQVGTAIAGVVLGGAVAVAVRLWAVPARPERAGTRTLRGLRLTVATVLRRLERDVVSRPGRVARRLEAHIDRLHEAALALDDLLVRLPDRALPSGVAVAELRDHVFELQLSAERVVQAVGQVIASGALPVPARREVQRALEAARGATRGEQGAAAGIAPSLAAAERLASEASAPARAASDVRRLRTSLSDLARAVRWVREAVPDRTLPAPADWAPPPAGPPPAPGPHGLAQPTRQAIQATVAAALAMAAGAQLSSARWFWAVIAAFVMFVGATTVADTIQRAWLRVLGTVLGAGAGILLGALVAGHPRLELASAFACVFLAYWLFRASYAWLLFWFTALIALLYRLLGRFTPELMVLRIEETAIGAAIGVVVAALVLPVRARTRVRTGTAEVLRAAADWLDVAVTARAARGEAAPLGTARGMEDRLRALRASARPLVGGAVAAPRAAHLVHAATALVLYARHLAPGEALARMDGATRAEVAEAGRRLASAARRAAASLAGERAADADAGARPAAEPIARALASLRGPAAERAGPATPPVWLQWLALLDEALRDLATVAAGPERPARRAGRATARIARARRPAVPGP